MDFSQDVDVNVNDQANGAMRQTTANGSIDRKASNIDERKLFIGGLNFKVTEEELKGYFSKYGNVASVNVKCDPITGRFRGFAFIVFSSPESVDKAIEAGEHLINGRKVEPRRAKSRPGKIFVGGLADELTDDEIKNYFAQFGNITAIDLPFDKEKNKRKNFCFITFDNENVVADLLKKPKQSINGKPVDVKKATPKPDPMYASIPPAGGAMMPNMRNGARAPPGGYMAPQWGAPTPGGFGNYGGSGYGGYDGYDYYNGYDASGYEYGPQGGAAMPAAPYGAAPTGYGGGRPMGGSGARGGKAAPAGGKMRGGAAPTAAGGKANARNIRHQPY
uniref:RRM domain-containing protein n=1 Tax=Cuerna arida TaxID=1464854 RepID=A0A1B6G6K9_9HEMI